MKKVVALLALALASIALVACGGDDSDTTTTTTGGGETTNGAAAGGGTGEGGGASTLAFEADPNGGLAYTTTEATTKPGKVTIEFKNPQPLTHDVRIEGANGEDLGGTELIESGSDTATVNLKPGSDTFYCSVPGHREAGMEGTLTVK